ncbi:amino acid adenylation domain-containing protein [Aliikangiella marina]|uniref:Amino acid adenylation domain-containing protein n=1 Tax=Aliikangiella marina TaxID=1712262 RepID=A0A545TJN3_9GAMM|nr:non-ribosomal peptide synthetase [Aliikangiella marina]TQV77371.1 amino acid adenylation domain-containing protein [Aliikangiella marina]
MNVIEFLLEMKELHIFVNLENGKLKVQGNSEALNDEIKQRLASFKQDIFDVFEELNIRSNRQLAPSTFSQVRLWFLDQLEGGSVHYNMPSTSFLKGYIDLNAIDKAHNAIIERHESLRTTFVCKDDEPYQVINEFKPVNPPVIDLSELNKEEKELKIKEISHQETRRPFDLEKDYMMRWQVIKVADNEHVLLRTMHHIASDGWSGGVLAKEFSALYKAFESGQESPLPPLVIQYSDYAHWQRQWLKGEVLENQLKHWTQKLKGIPSVHKLPLDNPRPENYTHNGAHHASHISDDTYHKFNQLCLQNNATLFMGLHAAFSLLLSRYSNEDDIVIGTPIANREQPDVAPLIGFFLNTLVLRSNIAKVDNFKELLEQSKSVALDAYANQQVPFEQLVKELDVESSLSYQPVFQIMLILQNNENNKSDISKKTKWIPLNSEFNYAKFELTLSVTQMTNKMFLVWNYNTDLFEHSSIQRLAANFNRLIESIVESPESSLLELPLLSEAEYQFSMQSEHELTDTKQPLYVHELFEQNVARHPDKLAVSFKNQHVTYSQLNRKANHIAHELRRLGVKPRTVVAVKMSSSFELVASVLAIIKLGAAYLPIDPKSPANRLQFISDKSKLAFLVFDGEKMSGLNSHVTMINISELASESISVDNLNADDFLPPKEQVVYTMFTSGSTGTPKGVQISHSNLLAYYESIKDVYNITEDERFLQFSSFSFDIFVEEMFVSLLSGGALILKDEADLQSTTKFWQQLNKYDISTISIPTAYWHELCYALDSSTAIAPCLRQVIIGGEAMSAKMLQKWRLFISNKTRIINTYGPTETTVIASAFDATNFNSDKKVPIGKPLRSAKCYVLNAELQPCPISVEGELYISGESVSLGYLNDSRQTKLSFIDNPFSSGQGSKLYKTGDKVRWLEDGNIEFVGRLDSQLKIRGHRVELDEIEFHIAQCTDVEMAIVLSHRDDKGNIRLRAFIHLDKEMIESHTDLIENVKSQLSQSLPEYMLPSNYSIVDEFPLTITGKVDRKALIETELPKEDSTYKAAESETEKALVTIWGDLLGIESNEISVNDNFFELGGHSLLVVRLVGEVRKQLGQEITIKSVFENSEVHALSLLIDSIKKQSEILSGLASGSSDDIEEIEW